MSTPPADLHDRLRTFMDRHVYPLEAERDAFTHAHPWQLFPPTEDLKAKARAAGLWPLIPRGFPIGRRDRP